MPDPASTDPFALRHLPPRPQWPDLVFDLPELQFPARLNCVTELLDHHAQGAAADRIALRDLRQGWSYAQLSDRVNRIAEVLRHDLKLIAGNRILLRGGNTLMMAACILAVWKAGGIAVPTMPLLRSAELAAIIDKAQIDLALCDGSLRGELQAAHARGARAFPIVYFNGEGADSLERRMTEKTGCFDACDTAADDVCLIAFTSGTTGRPKGTMHFHRDLLAICACFPRAVLQSCSGDIFVGTPPLAFTYGLGGLLLFPLHAGATAILLDRPVPETMLRAIEECRATVCFTAPTGYRQMLPLLAGHDLSSLRQAVSAGEPLPVATRDAWRQATGIDIIDGIGSTEMLHIFISASGSRIRPGATGKPVAGYQARVVDAEGRELGPDRIGRLAVKGPTGCRYLADDRQTDYVHDGWNLTGDLYETDADGYFWYRGRSDDMIVSAGYNIAAVEVEQALLTHAAVAECAVVAAPDPERGQVVKAHVVLHPGYPPDQDTTDMLQQFVKQAIAPYKYPRVIDYCAALPRTDSGKLQRFRLRPAACG